MWTKELIPHNKMKHIKSSSFAKRIIHNLEMVKSFEGVWACDKEASTWIASYYNGENEITELIEGYITVFFLSAGIADNNKEIECIIHQLESLANEEQCDWLYLEVYDQDGYFKELSKKIHPSWEKMYYFIYKRLDGPIDEINDSDIVIRNAIPQDEKFIMDCLEKAYIAGLHPTMKKMVNIESMLTKIRGKYTPFFSKNRLVFISEVENQICGHATFDLNKEEAEVIDVFITDSYRGQGISRKLTVYGEKECYRRGIRYLRGNVDLFSQGQIVLSHLKKSGWNISSVVYGKSLY